MNWLLSASGLAITMEPMFYWRDALDPLHLRLMSDRNPQRFAGCPANPAAHRPPRERLLDPLGRMSPGVLGL
jgi:hypothetical protein